MSQLFKLMVEFNYDFFDVIIKSENKITFKEVFNEIKSQLDFDFSLELHSFEIWDKMFGVYAKVFNENQFIENQSKIRIKFKDISHLNDLLKSCRQNNCQVNEVKIIATIEATRLKSIDCEDQTSRDQIIREEDCNDDSDSWMTLNDDKTSPFVSIPSHLSDPDIKRITRVSKDMISEFKELTHSILTVVKELGSIRGRSGQMFWEKVAKHMKSKGFKVSWNECRSFQDKYVSDYYGLALSRLPNLMTAKEVYPLFEFIDSIDWRDSMSVPSYRRIEDLRNRFIERSEGVSIYYLN